MANDAFKLNTSSYILALFFISEVLLDSDSIAFCKLALMTKLLNSIKRLEVEFKNLFLLSSVVWEQIVI